MNQDLEHLRLLSIFHYVAAAMMAVFACFPVIHLIIGIVALVSNEPPQIVGVIFIAVASTIIVAGWTLAICVALAGKFLSERRRYLYCFVIACIECLFMPVGTVLGVFTIIVLMRPSVKQLFESEGIPPAPEPYV